MLGGGWSVNPIAYSAATGAATIPFESMGLGNWPELLLQIVGLQTGAGTPDYHIQFGVGGVYDTTNYVHYGATGTTGLLFATSVPAATSSGALIELVHFNVAQQTWASRLSGGRENAATGARTAIGLCTTATAWDCLRISNSTATNWTANGGVNIYGRQP